MDMLEKFQKQSGIHFVDSWGKKRFIPFRDVLDVNLRGDGGNITNTETLTVHHYEGADIVDTIILQCGGKAGEYEKAHTKELDIILAMELYQQRLEALQKAIARKYRDVEASAVIVNVRARRGE